MTLRLEPTFDETNVDWPFDVPASQMALEPGVVCLTGEDVGPIWEALGDTPFRRAVVFDGEETHALLVQPHTPGHMMLSDPCRDA